jgi:chromosomal replication initiation ATPase DnaA
MVVGTITHAPARYRSYIYACIISYTRPKTMNIKNIIIDLVCEDTGVTKNLLMSKRRNQFIVDAKQIIVFALSELGFTLQYIGEALNYRDHTTVHHLKNKQCRQTHENRFRASLIVKSYLHMALYENARLKENLEAELF